MNHHDTVFQTVSLRWSQWRGLRVLWLPLVVAPAMLRAAEPWQSALARMPLPVGVTQLDKSNCVRVVLGALRSNQVVKALVFLPGATDELYFFDRVHARLPAPSPTLLDAVVALTNQTRIRATFRPPFLLLRAGADPTEPRLDIRHPSGEERLERKRLRACVLLMDRDWDHLEPLLRRRLSMGVRPWVDAPDSWHFFRANLAAWDLTGWETVRAVALATGTTCTVYRRKVVFALADHRPSAPHHRP